MTDLNRKSREAEEADVPEGFRVHEITARSWAVFECVGAMPDAIQDTWHSICSEFFPASGYEPTYEMDIEAYPEGDMSDNNYRKPLQDYQLLTNPVNKHWQYRRNKHQQYGISPWKSVRRVV